MANMVKDLGLSPNELRALATKGTNAKELPCLLEALRISIRALAEKEPMLLNDLRRGCSMCEHKRECDDDIAAGTLVPGYQRYCVNVDSAQRDSAGRRNSIIRSVIVEARAHACDSALVIETNGELSFVRLRCSRCRARHRTSKRGNRRLIDGDDDAAETRRTTALLMHHSFDLRQYLPIGDMSS